MVSLIARVRKRRMRRLALEAAVQIPTDTPFLTTPADNGQSYRR